MKELAIETLDLQKSYGTIHALEGISLGVPKGEIFGFLGPNGAGKTTFIKTILGFIKPGSGSVKIFGEVMHPGLKKRIGYLPERVNIHPFLSAFEFVLLSAKLSQMTGPDISKKCIDVIEKVGLAGKENIKVGTFSKGMTQRLGLAQAIIHEPELLLLDEPGSGLDPIGIKDMRELILAEKKRSGMSVFINSHRLLEVEKLCDHVAILNKGKLVAAGSMNDLTKNKNQVEVVLEIPEEKVINYLKSISSEFGSENNRVTFVPNESADIRKIPASIIECGGNILKYERLSENLEEIFIRLTGDTNNEI